MYKWQTIRIKNDFGENYKAQAIKVGELAVIKKKNVFQIYLISTKQPLFEHILFNTVELAIDICKHVLSRYKEYFLMLEEYEWSGVQFLDICKWSVPEGHIIFHTFRLLNNKVVTRQMYLDKYNEYKEVEYV